MVVYLRRCSKRDAQRITEVTEALGAGVDCMQYMTPRLNECLAYLNSGTARRTWFLGSAIMPVTDNCT